MEAKFKDLQVGDEVIRMLGGTLPIKVVVSKVDNELITCTVPPEKYGQARAGMEKVAKLLGKTIPEEEKDDMPTWTFSINNGAEIDPDLGWTETYTGSYLIIPEKI